MTKQEFLDRAREKHGYKYDYPNLNDKVLSNDEIEVVYNGITYKQKVVKHILLGRCPEKNTPIKTTEEYIKSSKEIWGDKYDYSLVEYKGALKKVKIIFDGIIFEQVAISHLRKMAPEDNMNQDYFIKRSKDRWGNKYDYSLVNYTNSKSKVKIIYNGEIYEQRPEKHLICAPENIKYAIRKTTQQFIIEANIVHDNKFNYDKTKYIKNQIKVIINCPKHGDFEQRPLSHLQGNGCSNCNESKGEKEISKFLNKFNLSYNRQHKFSDCRNIFELPFDFYIEKIRTCIEFDGEQHFLPLSFFGGQEALDRVKINDKIKSDYCEDNYISLIRIKYTDIDNIYQILWNNLKDFIKNNK
jgi:hypothetical protein